MSDPSYVPALRVRALTRFYDPARVLRPGGELHVADWGPASDPVMRALSLSIRLRTAFGTLCFYRAERASPA